MSRTRILVVDDEPAMLRSVERILGRDHDVRTATGAAPALAAASRFAPHLAIVDIRMPEMDGFALMRELKRVDRDMRVILMTGSVYEIDTQLTRAIREEAFYYINKPFDRELLRTLVQRCIELRALEETNREHVGHLEGQLAEARAFQQSMLPPRAATIGSFRIDALYEPCEEIAGDLYDYGAAASGSVTLLVADVSGHGVSAAMLTGIVKSAFHAARNRDYDPARVVRRVAEGIAAFPANRFVTLFCARLSAANGSVEYVNAGHDGGMILVAKEPARSLLPTGPIISPALPGMSWECETTTWTPGARLLLYTDGISETQADEQMFGVDRIREVAAQALGSDESLPDRIMSETNRFAAGRPAQDDRTLLCAAEAGLTSGA